MPTRAIGAATACVPGYIASRARSSSSVPRPLYRSPVTAEKMLVLYVFGVVYSLDRGCGALNTASFVRRRKYELDLAYDVFARQAMIAYRTFVRYGFHHVDEASQSEQVPDDFLNHQISVRTAFTVHNRNFNDAFLCSDGAQDELRIVLAAIETANLGDGF